MNLDTLRSFFTRHAGRAADDASNGEQDQDLRVAACALLLEMAHADDEFTADERTSIEDVLVRHFALDAAGARELMETAERERDEATDLHHFTSVINQSYDEGQRLVLAELLWRVVYADGQLSAHEDYLARKLAHLLDLRPGYLAEARKRAQNP